MTSEMSPDVQTPNAVPAPPYLLDAELLANQLQSDIRRGLSSYEAQIRLTREGPNELVTQPATPRGSTFSLSFKTLGLPVACCRGDNARHVASRRQQWLAH
ncbi:cation-transporting P-type ATPase [Pseudomonas sp. PCH446]